MADTGDQQLATGVVDTCPGHVASVDTAGGHVASVDTAGGHVASVDTSGGHVASVETCVDTGLTYTQVAPVSPAR